MAWAIALCVVLLLASWTLSDTGEEGWSTTFGIAGFILGIGIGITACNDSDWSKKQDAERAAQAARDREPRVVREADGCKVYTFKSGDHWHFFTRCPGEQTSTDTARTVRQGKTSRTEYSTIETR
jgi:hypothetical protein